MAGGFLVFGSLLGNAYMKEMDKSTRGGEGKEYSPVSLGEGGKDKDTHGVGTSVRV